MTAAMVLLIGFGLVTAAYPRLWWNLSRWQYRHPEAVEPSEAAFAVARIAGVLLAVLGLFFGLSVDDAARDQEAEVKHRQAVAADPEAVVRRYGDLVMREVRSTALPPRRLGKDRLDSLAVRSRDIISVQPAEGFTKTGGVTVSVNAGSAFSGTDFCLFLPETVDGQPTIARGGCRPPLDDQRIEVEGLARRIMSAARAKGVSPRDETVVRQVTGPYMPGRFSVLRGPGLEVQYAPDFPYGDRDTWCVLLPERADGIPEILQAVCPSPPPASTTSVPGS